MKYRNIFHKAYDVTINNPILWIFGLFLSAGFNLNMVYIGSAGWYKPHEAFNQIITVMQAWPFAFVSGGVAVVALLFLFSTLIKTFFVTEAHTNIHELEKKQCPLCVSQISQKTLRQRLPKSYSVGKIAIASIVTIAVTLVSAGVLNYVIAQSAVANTPVVLSISALATVIIIWGMGCWNVFTVLFILWYGKSFQSAAQLATTLLVDKTKQVFEFIILLAALYAGLVIVGSVLIIMSQFSLTALFSPLESLGVPHQLFTIIRILAMVVFWVWLSITNVFFNLCLFVFFDDLVKPIIDKEVVGAIEGMPTIPV